MISTTTNVNGLEPQELARMLESKGLKVVKLANGNWVAQCPAPKHEDSQPSFGFGPGKSVPTVGFCQGCKRELPELLEYLDLPRVTKPATPKRSQPKPERRHQYTDQAGVVLFESRRTPQGKWMLYRPDGNDNTIWGMAADWYRQAENGDWYRIKGDVADPANNGYQWFPECPLVPYGLAELTAADKSETLWLPEGEGDVDTLRALGLTATTNPTGAGNWDKIKYDFVEGHPVVILGDADTAGRKRVEGLLRKLPEHKPAAVKVVWLPGQAERDDGFDVSDWLRNGGSKEELLKIMEKAVIPTEGVKPSEVKINLKLPEGKYLDDIGNGERLIHWFGDKIRHTVQFGWLSWTGTHWNREGGERAVEGMASVTARRIYHEVAACISEKAGLAMAAHAKQSAKRSNISGMMFCARSMEPIAIDAKDLDCDRWLFNCKNGTIDLHTGKMHKHNPKDLLTQFAPVTFLADAQCPRWMEFLDRIMAGQKSLITYLQRMLGMCLTGDIGEQILPMFIGPGANGKSTLLDTIIGILGDYGCEGAPDMLLIRRQDAHPTERADLFGKRLVVTSETAPGRRLRTELVKKLTGDLWIKARYMRHDFFQFERTHKVLISTNHEPIIPDSSLAMWRRIKKIRFDVVIPPEEQDKNLSAKLKKEWPGILIWLLEGCLDWQENGIGEPDEVRQATKEYRQQENPLAEFFEDRCQFGTLLFASNRALWDEYNEWSKANGEKYPLVKKREFSKYLPDYGCEPERIWDGKNQVRGWTGVTIKQAQRLEQKQDDDAPF